MEDKMKMSRAPLPPDVRERIAGLTKDFDPEAKASIGKRTAGTFAKIERATPEKKE